MCSGVRARAGHQPWRLLCGEKIHRPPSLFSPVLHISGRWSFQYHLGEGASGLLRVERNVLTSERRGGHGRVRVFYQTQGEALSRSQPSRGRLGVSWGWGSHVGARMQQDLGGAGEKEKGHPAGFVSDSGRFSGQRLQTWSLPKHFATLTARGGGGTPVTAAGLSLP